MGAEALGIFAMTSVLVMAVRQAQAGAVLDPLSVYGPRRLPEERRGYFGFVAALQVIWVGGITGVSALAGALLWFDGVIDTASVHAILASLLYANLITLQYMLRRRFYVEEMPERALVQSLAFLCLCLVAFALYAMAARVSVVGVYVVLSACSLLVCLADGRGFRRAAGLPSSAERSRYLREHRQFGGWTLLTVPMSIISYQAYFLVAGSVLSVEEAGYLKAADALVAPFAQAAIGVSLMFVPIAARRLDSMGMGAQVRYAARLVAVTMAMAAAYAAAVFLLGVRLTTLIFGQHMAAAADVVHTMALVPVMIAGGIPAGIMLAAHRRADLRFVAYGVAGVLSALVGFPLVAWTGIEGAAWGLVLSQAALSISLWLALVLRRRPEPAGQETRRG